MTSPGTLLVCRQLRAAVSTLELPDRLRSGVSVRSSRLSGHALINLFGFRVWAEFDGLRRSDVPVCDLGGISVCFRSTLPEASDLVELHREGVGTLLRLHLPPADLDEVGCEVYQGLRSDGVEAAQAAALARLLGTDGGTASPAGTSPTS